jgi:isopenicillin-N epimerase
MTAFRLPDDTDPVALRRGLWQRYRIEAPIIERFERYVHRPDASFEQQSVSWRYLIRASTWWYNTEEEIDRLAAALLELLPECRGG